MSSLEQLIWTHQKKSEMSRPLVLWIYNYQKCVVLG